MSEVSNHNRAGKNKLFSHKFEFNRDPNSQDILGDKKEHAMLWTEDVGSVFNKTDEKKGTKLEVAYHRLTSQRGSDSYRSSYRKIKINTTIIK